MNVLNGTKLILTKSIYSSEFEVALLDFFDKNNIKSLEELDELTIDMTRIIFIDVVALLNVIAFVQKIRSVNNECEIFFKLPVSRKVLQILRVFKFYQGIEFATKLSFEIFLDEKNRYIYAKEKMNQDRYIESVGKLSQIDSENITNLVNKGAYFPIKSFRILDSNELSEVGSTSKFSSLNNEFEKQELILVKDNLPEKINVVEQSAISWKEPKISDVLYRNLKDKHGRNARDYVPSRVIYECLTNAFRHAECNLIQTISKFNNKASYNSKSSDHFSIAFWDNGKSMIDVLGDAIKKGKNVKAPVRAYKNDEDYPDFYIKYKDSNGKKFYRNGWKVSSSIDPLKKTYNDLPYFLFAATFFPGITTNTDGSSSMGADHTIKTTGWDNPGMGLALLLNTVADVLNGKIIVRSGRYRMILKSMNNLDDLDEPLNPAEAVIKAPDSSSLTSKKSYIASIRQVSESAPEFLGNLIAIHLPISG